MKYFLTRAFVVLCFILTISSCEREEPGKDVYRLTLGDVPSETRDGIFYIGGSGPIGGHALLRINDNPILFYESGGDSIAINQYLRQGQNTARISGEYGSPIFLNLVIIKGEEATPILENIEIKPDDGKKGFNVHFNADIDYELPIFSPSEESLSKEQIRSDLIAVVQDICQRCQRNDRSVAQKFFEGQRLSYAVAYGRNSKDITSHIKGYEALIADMADVELPKEQDIEVVFGESIHLVKQRNQPYLFKFTRRSSGNEDIQPAIGFARVSGRWIIWM